MQIMLKLAIAISCVMTLLHSQASAQADPYEQYRIYHSGLNLININWANDSSQFVFQEASDVGVYTEGLNTWHSYSIMTEHLTSADFWPLQPDITVAQWQTFEIYPLAKDSSFVFASPNGRYIVYNAIGTDSHMPIALPLGIADLNTSQYEILDEVLVSNSAMFSIPTIDYAAVRWSPDNNFFTISTELPTTLIYFVDISNGINNPEVHPLHEDVIINDEVFDIRSVLDIVGDNLLLYGGPRGNRSIVVWNATSADGYEIPIVGEVAGAKFYGETVDQVLFVDEEGLKDYYSANSIINVISPAITSSWAAGGAYFSPNGEYLAIYDGGQEGPSRAYVISVSELSRATPSATFMGGLFLCSNSIFSNVSAAPAAS